MISKNNFFQLWALVQIGSEPKGKHHDNKQEKDKCNEERREGFG